MIKLGVLMDPISEISIKKDTSFAMLLKAQERGYDNYYLEMPDIGLQDGIAWGRMRKITVKDDPNHWFDFGEEIIQPLAALDILIMRKDPPFDIDYVYATYLLEQAEAQGLMVVNKPASLRDANEKLFTAWFEQCCPKTLVSMRVDELKEFVQAQKKAVVKRLDVMGGRSVFLLVHDDPNLPVILDTVTQGGQHLVMMQEYISASQTGDKRIILIDGELVPHGLLRIPPPGDFRGNLSVGATFTGSELTERDRWICKEVGPVLKEKGLIFVGIDVIGEYLTEINVTSPTGVRELDQLFNLDICGILFDCLEGKLGK